MLMVMLAEMWGSFLFAMTVCSIGARGSMTASSTDGGWNGFTAILGLTVAIFVTAGVSGAGINPAVAFGLNLMSMFLVGNEHSVALLWPYLVGPLLGGAMAGLLWSHYHCHHWTDQMGGLAGQVSHGVDHMGRAMRTGRTEM